MKYVDDKNSLTMMCSFTNECSLRCSFCHMLCDPRRLKEIPLNINNILKYLDENVDYFNTYGEVKLNILGGELFHLDDEYYDMYYNFVRKAYEISKRITVPVTFFVLTNLYYPKERLEAFKRFIDFILMDTDFKLNVNTSFDFAHRFRNDEQVNVFENNCLEIADFLKEKNRDIQFQVESVLTKQAAEYLINNYDNKEDVLVRTFDNIYKNNICHVFSEYVLNMKENENLVPTNEDLITFYKLLIDEYPNHDGLQQFLPDSKISSADCNVIRFNNERVVDPKNCYEVHFLNDAVDQESSLFKDYCKISREGKMCFCEEKTVMNYFNNVVGCSFCEYNKRCNAHCYVCWALNARPDKCWQKDVFKYLDSKNV